MIAIKSRLNPQCNCFFDPFLILTGDLRWYCFDLFHNVGGVNSLNSVILIKGLTVKSAETCLKKIWFYMAAVCVSLGAGVQEEVFRGAEVHPL